MKIDADALTSFRSWALAGRSNSFDDQVYYYPTSGKRPHFLFGQQWDEFTAYVRIRFGSYCIALREGQDWVDGSIVHQYLDDARSLYGWHVAVERADPAVEALGRILSEEMSPEVGVYSLRISQCSADSVHSMWYNELEEFVEWSTLVRDGLALVAIPTSGSGVDPATVELLAPMIPSIAIEDHRERSRSDDAIRLVTRMGDDPSSLSTITTRRVELLLDEIVEEFSRLIAHDASEWRVAFRECLELIRRSFGLRIVDYLSVEDKSAVGPRLSIQASSWKADSWEAEDSLQLSDAYYSTGLGVTGSVFLLRQPGPASFGRWVGTPLVDADNRSSTYHRRYFETEYKRVTSFWVFPVGDASGNLRGALRAIDIEGGVEGELADWPFTMRLELSAVATHLSRFLKMLDQSVMGSFLPDPAFGAARELADAGLFDEHVITVPYLSRLLYRLSQFASARYEHRSVSCTVVVVDDATIDYWKPMERYPAVSEKQQTGRLIDAIDFLSQVVPGAGVIVCPVEGLPSGERIELSYAAVVETQALSMAEVSRVHANRAALFLELDGERGRVRFLVQGRHVADYYLEQKRGVWRLRILEHTSNRILAPSFCPASIRPEILRDVLALVWDYSYEGHGGMIVVTDRLPRTEAVQKKGFRVNLGLGVEDHAQLANVLAVDGGVHVDLQGRVQTAGIIFVSDRSEWSDNASGGSRHATASYLRSILEDAVIFVVSANRRVTVHSTTSERSIEF